MDRRDALKVMGTGLAAAFMMNIAPAVLGYSVEHSAGTEKD